MKYSVSCIWYESFGLSGYTILRECIHLAKITELEVKTQFVNKIVTIDKDMVYSDELANKLFKH